MGQKLQDDKIGQLSESGGTITLAPSLLTIGGQQYQTEELSRLITDDVVLSASNIYMIFAVISSGNIELRISTNFNSVGPAGFNSWKLVGAFIANANQTVDFGSFLTITGIPRSLTRIQFDGFINSSNFGIWTNKNLYYFLKGNLIHCMGYANIGSRAAGEGRFGLPSNFTVSSSLSPSENHVGTFAFDGSTAVTYGGHTRPGFNYINPTYNSSAGGMLSVVNANTIFADSTKVGWNLIIPIEELTNTPIEDL